MTLKEIREKVDSEYEKVKADYRDSLIKYLEENGLRDKVIRCKDSKVGKLYVVSDWTGHLGYSIHFHPLKNDGTESKRYEIVFTYSDSEITDEFKPICGG